MTGGNGLLVDDSSDVEAFGHTDIVEILYQCHCLTYTELLSSQTSQDVRLCITGKRNEGLRVSDSLLFEQSEVATVTVDHHRFILFQQFVQPFAALDVFLDDLDVHVVRDSQCSPYSRLSATHDNYVLDIGIMLLADNLTDIGDILLGGHDIDEVVDVQLIHTARDDGVTTTFNRNDMIGVVRATKVAQRLIQDLC